MCCVPISGGFFIKKRRRHFCVPRCKMDKGGVLSCTTQGSLYPPFIPLFLGPIKQITGESRVVFPSTQPLLGAFFCGKFSNSGFMLIVPDDGLLLSVGQGCHSFSCFDFRSVRILDFKSPKSGAAPL